MATLFVERQRLAVEEVEVESLGVFGFDAVLVVEGVEEGRMRCATHLGGLGAGDFLDDLEQLSLALLPLGVDLQVLRERRLDEASWLAADAVD